VGFWVDFLLFYNSVEYSKNIAVIEDLESLFLGISPWASFKKCF
jgi:hypothetical protein